MSYAIQYGLGVAVAIVLAIIGAVQLADPATLGISPKVVAWCSVMTPGLGILASVLPSVRRPPVSREPGPPADPMPRDA